MYVRGGELCRGHVLLSFHMTRDFPLPQYQMQAEGGGGGSFSVAKSVQCKLQCHVFCANQGEPEANPCFLMRPLIAKLRPIAGRDCACSLLTLDNSK